MSHMAIVPRALLKKALIPGLDGFTAGMLLLALERDGKSGIPVKQWA
jgi:hypothetical protein